jgi:hypothetical protein
MQFGPLFQPFWYMYQLAKFGLNVVNLLASFLLYFATTAGARHRKHYFDPTSFRHMGRTLIATSRTGLRDS